MNMGEDDGIGVRIPTTRNNIYFIDDIRFNKAKLNLLMSTSTKNVGPS